MISLTPFSLTVMHSPRIARGFILYLFSICPMSTPVHRLQANSWFPHCHRCSKCVAISKYASSDTVSTTVVIRGDAITAGSR